MTQQTYKSLNLLNRTEKCCVTKNTTHVQLFLPDSPLVASRMLQPFQLIVFLTISVKLRQAEKAPESGTLWLPSGKLT